MTKKEIEEGTIMIANYHLKECPDMENCSAFYYHSNMAWLHPIAISVYNDLKKLASKIANKDFEKITHEEEIKIHKLNEHINQIHLNLLNLINDNSLFSSVVSSIKLLNEK